MDTTTSCDDDAGENRPKNFRRLRHKSRRPKKLLNNQAGGIALRVLPLGVKNLNKLAIPPAPAPTQDEVPVEKLPSVRRSPMMTSAGSDNGTPSSPWLYGRTPGKTTEKISRPWPPLYTSTSDQSKASTSGNSSSPTPSTIHPTHSCVTYNSIVSLEPGPSKPMPRLCERPHKARPRFCSTFTETGAIEVAISCIKCYIITNILNTSDDQLLELIHDNSRFRSSNIVVDQSLNPNSLTGSSGTTAEVTYTIVPDSSSSRSNVPTSSVSSESTSASNPTVPSTNAPDPTVPESSSLSRSPSFSVLVSSTIESSVPESSSSPGLPVSNVPGSIIPETPGTSYQQTQTNAVSSAPSILSSEQSYSSNGSKVRELLQTSSTSLSTIESSIVRSNEGNEATDQQAGEKRAGADTQRNPKRKLPVDFVIPRHVITTIILDDIFQEFGYTGKYHIEYGAIVLLHEKSELFLASFFEGLNHCSKHTNRQTVNESDATLFKHLVEGRKRALLGVPYEDHAEKEHPLRDPLGDINMELSSDEYEDQED